MMRILFLNFIPKTNLNFVFGQYNSTLFIIQNFKPLANFLRLYSPDVKPGTDTKRLILYVANLLQELHGGRYRTCIGQSRQTVNYSSRAPGQGACLKGMSRTITMQGFRHAAISDVEKTKLRQKNFQSQWTVKYRSRALG